MEKTTEMHESKGSYKLRKYRHILNGFTAEATLYPFAAETYWPDHVYVEVFDERGRCVDFFRFGCWEHAIEVLTAEFGFGWDRRR